MVNILNTHDVVKRLLIENPETRDDDFKLLYYVYNEYLDNLDTRTFKEVMFCHKLYGLPSFETVRRTRAKIQNESEDLKASAIVKQYRAEQEQMYRDYASKSLEEL